MPKKTVRFKIGGSQLIPPPLRGVIYTPRDSRGMARHSAISSLLNILKKIQSLPEEDLVLRIVNIREDARNLLLEIATHAGVWTTPWAFELEQIITSARRASILVDLSGESDD